LQDQEENIKNKVAAYEVLAVETAITALITLLLKTSVDFVAAYSALIGGLAFILPNVLFARFAFKHSAKDSANLTVIRFYIGEAIKLALTAVIFVACFLMIGPLSVVALFATFILVLVINLIGGCLMASNYN